ncbi:MAG: hypothetical protein JST59_00515 [Actinobacteria bacterium]|nr:hypothetical protein [Actinomycetota bacterium]
MHKQYVYQYLEDVVKKEDTLNIIIRSSDRGCEETVLKELEKLKEEAMRLYNINLNLISSDVGEIAESDVRDAHLFGALMFTFGTTTKPEAVRAMKTYNIAAKNHKLLHSLVEDIRNAIVKKSKREDSRLKERGNATIAEVFKVSTGKNEQKLAAGLKIGEGRLCKKFKYRLYRNGQPISKTIRLDSIKHFKKEVVELKKGEECTVLFDSDVDFKKGDVLRGYE